MEVALVFLIAGAIILIGFLGGLSFEKTRIPDVLLLLGIGILLGPVLKLVGPSTLSHFAEYFGLFALMIILFEGGMDIDADKLIKEFGAASLLVLLSFVLSAVSIAGFLYYLYGWDATRSLLLGTILGCTSAAIIIPIVCRMSLKEEIKTLLSVESALSDVLAVVFTISLIEFVKLESIGIRTPFRAVASSFSIAIVSGVMSGFIWLKVLDFFSERRYSYMTTLAAMLIIFGLVDFFGGSGPIAILIFGVILGNSHDFVKFLRLKTCVLLDDTIKFLHGEITFFIRTFFFVYMGMMITFTYLDLQFLSLSVALVLIIILARFASVATMGSIFHEKKADRFVMMAMLPRGLASAVLATMPVAANIKDTEPFLEYTFAVIVLTNIIMTIGVFIFEKKQGSSMGVYS
jgi:cell volume regulation protein A